MEAGPIDGDKAEVGIDGVKMEAPAAVAMKGSQAHEPLGGRAPDGRASEGDGSRREEE